MSVRCMLNDKPLKHTTAYAESNKTNDRRRASTIYRAVKPADMDLRISRLRTAVLAHDCSGSRCDVTSPAGSRGPYNSASSTSASYRSRISSRTPIHLFISSSSLHTCNTTSDVNHAIIWKLHRIRHLRRLYCFLTKRAQHMSFSVVPSSRITAFANEQIKLPAQTCGSGAAAENYMHRPMPQLNNIL